MKLLILGGTAWLGRELGRQAVIAGHHVSCLARGESGPVAEGAQLIVADRGAADAYHAVADRSWDAVVDVSWQPGMVRAALAALRPRARHWIYVSSGNVYADHSYPGGDESAALLPPTDRDEVDGELYGAAKVACEQACRAGGEDGLLIARAGLIAGPGDPSDRAGSWPVRAARGPDTPLLVPADDGQLTQLVDVRDLAAWLLRAGEQRHSGTYDAVGETLPLTDFVARSRRIAGHRGPVVAADGDWLAAQGVGEFMGPGALALWIHDPEWRGFCARKGTAAQAAGLALRPLEETLTDILADERARGMERERGTGLDPAREAELIAGWRSRVPA